MKSSLHSVTTIKVLHFCDDFPSVNVVPQENEAEVLLFFTVGKINNIHTVTYTYMIYMLNTCTGIFVIILSVIIFLLLLCSAATSLYFIYVLSLHFNEY